MSSELAQQPESTAPAPIPEASAPYVRVIALARELQRALEAMDAPDAEPRPGSQAADADSDQPQPYHFAKEQAVARFEREYLELLVATSSGNLSRAARIASVDRTTLYRLLERHGLRRGGARSDVGRTDAERTDAA